MTQVEFRTPILLAALCAAGLGCGDGFMTVESKGEVAAPSFETPATSPTTGGDAAIPTGPLQCGATEAFCQGACLDITRNTQHCGGCGIVCDSGTCDGGACTGEASEPAEEEPDQQLTCTVGEPCGNACMGGQTCVSGACATLTEIEGVWAQTNQARAAGANCGVYGQYQPAPALTLDPELNEAAQAHAVDMSVNNFFSHTGSDGSSFVVRIQRTDFAGQPIGENIAAGQRSPAEAVDGWVDSDGHCRNLMNPDATKIGVGYTTGGPYGTLWVQVFGR